MSSVSDRKDAWAARWRASKASIASAKFYIPMRVWFRHQEDYPECDQDWAEGEGEEATPTLEQRPAAAAPAPVAHSSTVVNRTPRTPPAVADDVPVLRTDWCHFCPPDDLCAVIIEHGVRVGSGCGLEVPEVGN